MIGQLGTLNRRKNGVFELSKMKDIELQVSNKHFGISGHPQNGDTWHDDWLIAQIQRDGCGLGTYKINFVLSKG